MDVNDLRIAVTLSGFGLFLALMAHTWNRRRRADHERAALLPFMGDMDDSETARLNAKNAGCAVGDVNHAGERQ